jgi:transposase-like protein
MEDKITTSSVKEFLKDYLSNSDTQLLEEGKEKNDILEVAKARGYNLEGSSDLAGFKTVFTFADKANLNRARLPKEKLLKALPGMIGKPVDVDHIRSKVVGHYIDYRYKASEDMVVAYGVFYKSNFGTEWETAKELFKAGKLGTSYEIWCPKSKRKALPDGTYELTEMEIAGGGLMFKEKPAFADAKVLVLAQIVADNQVDLVIASKDYTEDDIITSAEALMEAPVAPVIPTVQRIKCSNCQTEFDNLNLLESEKKCPNCKAIVDPTGVVKYPPQIIDFNLSCPSCRASNWKLLKSDEDTTDVHCNSCNKEYRVQFGVAQKSELLQKTAFVFISSANCLQCGTNIPFSTTSQAKQVDLRCPSCELKFSVDTAKQRSGKKIEKITELADIAKASAEGGSEGMDKIEDKIEEVPVAPIVADAPVEVKAVEVPVEVVPVEPVAEPVVETVVEPVKVDEVPAEVPAEEPVVAKEATKEEVELAKAVAKADKMKKYFKAACGKIKKMKAEKQMNKASADELEVAKVEINDLKAKIQLLEVSGVTIIERKNMLGEFGKDLSEKDILDDDKFEVAKVKKENAELKNQLNTASKEVAVKKEKQVSDLTETAKNIDKLAFRK